MMIYQSKRQDGFTLIEITTSIAILSILIALGIPAFGNVISRNQLRANANQFQDDLRQARYESRSRSNGAVTFCSIASKHRNADINCSTTEGFQHGWLWYAGTKLLGKSYISADKNLTVTTFVNFSVEFRKGKVTLWDRDDELTRTAINIPYSVNGVSAYPSVSFGDKQGDSGAVVFDETGRTQLTYSKKQSRE